MIITEICVTAGRKFADPGEPGTVLCCNVHFKAQIGGSESVLSATRRLLHMAEQDVEAHRDRLVSSLANRRSIQHVNDTLSDVMDGADEHNEEGKRLELQLEQLKLNPSIFNEQEES